MPSCPVIHQTNKVIRSCKETMRELQILRESLLNCEHCISYEICQLHELFNSKVDRVIAEIIEEWGW